AVVPPRGLLEGPRVAHHRDRERVRRRALDLDAGQAGVVLLEQGVDLVGAFAVVEIRGGVRGQVPLHVGHVAGAGGDPRQRGGRQVNGPDRRGGDEVLRQGGPTVQ